MKENKNMLKSLYIHIPFCDHICSYCDFKKIVCSNDLKEKYIKALIKELNYKSELFSNLETIYIGGGTPSSLPFYLLYDLLNALNKLINLNKIKEFTIEFNPNDIKENNINELIEIFNKYNINRISLGIQSFNDEKLLLMNRNHNKEQAILALDLLNKYNFDNINVDLIYGFKLDNFDSIKNDIDIAINKNIKHLSYYSLILEENTILYHKYKKKQFEMLDDDEEGILYNKINEYLKTKGFKRYEISNFSKENYESIHNLRVWNNEHYLACGVSGSYYIDNTRYTNTYSIKDYIDYIEKNEFDKIIDSVVNLSFKDIIDEELILGFRKEEGINIIEFEEKYNKNIFETYPKINDFIKMNILILENNHLKINPKDLYLENYILTKIL